ncbi:hypothetical protein PI126_g3258 [Phytophthora idaei]|nr:hypothetical protein PI126_g3258 [Phytophthora idaei]
MALVAKLRDAEQRDAEQQLTRVLQVIELHVEFTDALLRANGGKETSQSEVQALVEGLSDSRISSRPQPPSLWRWLDAIDDEDDTETVDEMEIKEEPHPLIKAEIVEEQSENCGNFSLEVDVNNVEVSAVAEDIRIVKVENTTQDLIQTPGSAEEVAESNTATTIPEVTASGPIICGAEGQRLKVVPHWGEEQRRDHIQAYRCFIIYSGTARSAVKKANTPPIDADRVFSRLDTKMLENVEKMCSRVHSWGES